MDFSETSRDLQGISSGGFGDVPDLSGDWHNDDDGGMDSDFGSASQPAKIHGALGTFARQLSALPTGAAKNPQKMAAAASAAGGVAKIGGHKGKLSPQECIAEGTSVIMGLAAKGCLNEEQIAGIKSALGM